MREVVMGEGFEIPPAPPAYAKSFLVATLCVVGERRRS
jgi:hypothetical protein